MSQNNKKIMSLIIYYLYINSTGLNNKRLAKICLHLIVGEIFIPDIAQLNAFYISQPIQKAYNLN